MTTQALDVGALTPPLWGFEEREKLMVFYERASGARLHANYFRPGGVHIDCPPPADRGHRRMVRDRSRSFCEDLHNLFIENRIFKQRNVDIGIVSPRGLLEAGASPARCCARPARPGTCAGPSPTSVTRRWSSTFPSAPTATAYERQVVRMEEMRQSVRIMKQCVEKLLRAPTGQGPVKMPNDGKVAPPSRAEDEALDGSDHPPLQALYGRLPCAGRAKSMPAVEAPKGEFGVYLVADGTDKPYRCKIRAPGFAHLSAMDFLCRKSMLADVSAILGSIDIVFGEVDR